MLKLIDAGVFLAKIHVHLSKRQYIMTGQVAQVNNHGIIDYLQSFDLFTEEEIQAFLKIGIYASLSKDDYFFEEGEVCSRVAFIISGTFRHFYRSQKGETITYCFSLTNNFVGPYSSFISKEHTVENIQAITDAQVYIIPKAEMDRLFETHESWLRFSKMIAERQYIKREKRIFILQKEKAINKYKALMDSTPEYIQHIPLQYLASYLGISQRHLSRTRKELAL